MAIFLLCFLLFVITFIIFTPKLNARQKKAADRIFESSATLQALKTASNPEWDCDIMEAESTKKAHFFSPREVHKGLVPRDARTVRRRMVYSYANLPSERLARIFTNAFVSDPTGSMLGGIDLVIAAQKEWKRLHDDNPRKAETVKVLSVRMQKIVAACVSSFSGRDDLVDGLLSCQDGNKILTYAIESSCRIVVAVPEIQRYLEYMWFGGLQGKRDDWKKEAEVYERAMQAHSARCGTSYGVAAARVMKSTRRATLNRGDTAANDAFRGAQAEAMERIEEMRLHDTVVDVDGDGTWEWNELRGFFYRRVRASGSVQALLSILVLPLVALWPPLEVYGKRATSDEILRRAFNTPPAVRFYLFEGQNLAFALYITTANLPIHRDTPESPDKVVEARRRNWLVLFWAAMSFMKEVEFVFARGVKQFAKDPNSVIALFASIGTLLALALNVCNHYDWIFYDGDGVEPDNDYGTGNYRFGQVWERCDEIVAPLAARELLAASMFLRWTNTLPRLAERSMFFGPLILSVRFMLSDTLKFLVLLFWIVLSFAVFFNVLYREPYGHPTVDLSGVGCPDLDEKMADFGAAIAFLWEATLDGTGYFQCFTASSVGYVATFAMYLYVLTSTILLVNMLIAMMSESFSNVQANKKEYYLFLKARQIIQWNSSSPVPPPLNVLRFPYELLWYPYAFMRRCFPTYLPRISNRESFFADTKEAYSLPSYWKDAAEDIVEEALEYVRDDFEEQTAELIKKINEHVVSAKQGIIGELTKEMAVLREELRRAVHDGEVRPWTPGDMPNGDETYIAVSESSVRVSFSDTSQPGGKGAIGSGPSAHEMPTNGTPPAAEPPQQPPVTVQTSEKSVTDSVSLARETPTNDTPKPVEKSVSALYPSAHGAPAPASSHAVANVEVESP